ncbi:MAG: PTS sugar transporter subunit IIB [Calditrichia bacterium]
MLQLVRIDDRLVHGQVVVGWGSVLHFDTILLVKEDVGEEEWEQELIRSACPDYIDLIFEDKLHYNSAIKEHETDQLKCISLIASLDTCWELVTNDFPVHDINVGGIHFKPDREEVLPYVYLSDEEKKLCRQIIDLGYQLIAQDLPSSPKVNLQDVL